MKTPSPQNLMFSAHAVACCALVLLTGCTTASQPGARAGDSARVAATSWASPATNPTPAHTSRPEYPWDMRRAGITGVVNVRCLVDASGSVREAEVLNASSDEFVPPALSAVRKWTFNPASVDGKPVAMWVNIPIRFELSD